MPVMINDKITDQMLTPAMPKKFILITEKAYPAKPKKAVCPKLKIPPIPQITARPSEINVQHIK